MFPRYDHSPGCTCPACLKVRKMDVGDEPYGRAGNPLGRVLGVLIVLVVVLVLVLIVARCGLGR